MLKIGDKVIVKDNSYSLKLTGKGLKMGVPGGIWGQISPEYTVKFINKKLPADQSFIIDKKIYNDTIIENDEGEVYLIKADQLVKVNTEEYKRVIKIQSERFEEDYDEVKRIIRRI